MTDHRTPSDHAPANARIAEYVAHYVAVPYCVLDHLFFDGRSCGTAIARLSQPDLYDPSKVPLVKPHRQTLPKRLSYVQPTPAACRLYGVSENRSEPQGAAALNRHIAISYFGAMGPTLRHLATRRELLPLLGKAAPRENVPHVLVTPQEVGQWAVLRVYHAVADVRRTIKHLTRLVEELSGHAVLGELVRDRDYGLAVLATTPKAWMRSASGLRTWALSNILIVVDLGPTAETLWEALAARWRSSP